MVLTSSRLLWTAAIALSLAAPAAADDADPIVADRSPLTFRDSGVYCNYGFGQKETTGDGVTDLLTAERAASSASPWSFYIMQYSERNKSTLDKSLIRTMAESGKKVILRVKLPGGHHPDIDVEASKKAIADVLDNQVRPQWLYAITLGEENVYWSGNVEALSELYHWCKERWPDLPVYQWWTPMEVPNARAETGWVALPADGWVIDLYLMERERFEKSVLRTLETGKPMVHIVWSSPTWPLYRKDGHDESTWWEAVGRPSFEEQMDICRAYNVPVAHFVTQPAEYVDGERVASIRWGWQAVDPRVRSHYNWLETLAHNLRHLPDGTFGYRPVTESMLDWAHAADAADSVTFGVDEQGRQTVTLTVTGKQLASRPGVQKLPLATDIASITCHMPPSATQLVDPVALPSQEGTVARVPIDFRIKQKQVSGDATVETDVFVRHELGGSASLRYSMDGRTWSDAITTTNASNQKEQTLRVVIPAAELADGSMLHVRVELVAAAGVKTKIASRLDELRIGRVYKDILAVNAAE